VPGPSIIAGEEVVEAETSTDHAAEDDRGKDPLLWWPCGRARRKRGGLPQQDRDRDSDNEAARNCGEPPIPR
jgi:hypothetical protein